MTIIYVVTLITNELSVFYAKQYKTPKYLLNGYIHFLTNSIGHDEIPQNTAPFQGLHC